MPTQSTKRITRLLIANRGEIARRINRAAKALAIETVLVVSDPDIGSVATKEVDQVVPIGGSVARDSYLNGEKIIASALKSGCDALHPGYGFLSEDPNFAERVLAAGLNFVGPSPASIRALGVKTTARKTVAAAGVPITPGSSGGASDRELYEAAKAIGLPVIIKAAAGGGGRGMRIVRDLGELSAALEGARAESLKNFGSDSVYLERYIDSPRHVEVQLFGDHYGNVVHFGTRDCSTQRRHQKLIEEAPAPFLDSETREKIHAAAVAAARSVGYYNAGTAEFLVKGSEFYFLEINTRIQVEHPVTEAITGVDLVQLQLKVAMGEELPFSRPGHGVNFNGHAIEFRINAEDVGAGFRPSIGEISDWSRPSVDGVTVREDSGYREGDTIPPFYDSLISKVIVTGKDRAEALFRGYNFLKRYEIKGVPTTVPFHLWLLANRDFQGEGIDIGYVERALRADTVEGELANALELAKLDPAHRNPFEELRAKEFVEVVSLVEIAPYALPVGAIKLEIRHELGGTFLGVPLASDGSPLGCDLWRRSNTRRGVLSAWG